VGFEKIVYSFELEIFQFLTLQNVGKKLIPHAGWIPLTSSYLGGPILPNQK